MKKTLVTAGRGPVEFFLLLCIRFFVLFFLIFLFLSFRFQGAIAFERDIFKKYL